MLFNATWPGRPEVVRSHCLRRVGHRRWVRCFDGDDDMCNLEIEGFGEETPGLASALAELGASRVCAPGSLQSPALDWRHGGRGVLAPLARFTDVEMPA